MKRNRTPKEQIYLILLAGLFVFLVSFAYWLLSKFIHSLQGSITDFLVVFIAIHILYDRLDKDFK